MADSNTENPELVKQHIDKNHFGDEVLKHKAGKNPPRKPETDAATPAHKPEQATSSPAFQRRSFVSILTGP